MIYVVLVGITTHDVECIPVRVVVQDTAQDTSTNLSKDPESWNQPHAVDHHLLQRGNEHEKQDVISLMIMFA